MTAERIFDSVTQQILVLGFRSDGPSHKAGRYFVGTQGRFSVNVILSDFREPKVLGIIKKSGSTGITSLIDDPDDFIQTLQMEIAREIMS